MITVRAVKAEDAGALARIYNPYVLNTTVSYEIETVSVEEFKQRIMNISRCYPYLVAEEDGYIIGFAYTSSFRSRPAYNWDAELSIYVDESCRGRGVGTMFMEKLITMLKAMNYVNLYSLIDVPNDGSMALHKRFGFSKAGYLKQTGYKLNAWRDTVILEKRLCSPENPLPVDTDWGKYM